MAHRTLVAYRTGDTYALHYAHWGADLATAITAETPFGGPPDTGSGPDMATLAESLGLDATGGYTSTTRVEPTPLASGVSPDGVLAAIDASIEALVVVEPAATTRTYLVCPLGVDGDGPLVIVGPTEDERALRAWVRSVTSRLGESVDSGTLSPETARRVLRRSLETRVAVHGLDDASFLRGD